MSSKVGKSSKPIGRMAWLQHPMCPHVCIPSSQPLLGYGDMDHGWWHHQMGHQHHLYIHPMPCHASQHMLNTYYLMPRSHQTFRPVLAVKLLGIMFKNWLFTLLQSDLLTNGVWIGRCDQRLTHLLNFCIALEILVGAFSLRREGLESHHIIIQIHNNDLWDWQYCAEHFPRSVWMWECYVEYCHAHI